MSVLFMVKAVELIVTHLSWQIAVKTREAKSKGEKERYTYVNAEFQRIARRDKPSSSINAERNRGKQQNGKD